MLFEGPRTFPRISRALSSESSSRRWAKVGWAPCQTPIVRLLSALCIAAVVGSCSSGPSRDDRIAEAYGHSLDLTAEESEIVRSEALDFADYVCSLYQPEQLPEGAFVEGATEGTLESVLAVAEIACPDLADALARQNAPDVPEPEFVELCELTHEAARLTAGVDEDIPPAEREERLSEIEARVREIGPAEVLDAYERLDELGDDLTDEENRAAALEIAQQIGTFLEETCPSP